MRKEIRWLVYWIGGALILGLLSGTLFKHISALAASLVMTLPAFSIGYYLVEYIINNPNRKLFPHFLIFGVLVIIGLYLYSVMFMDL